MDWNRIIQYLENAGLKLLEAIAIIFIGIILIKIIKKSLLKIFKRTKLNKVASMFITKTFTIGSYVLLIIIICQFIGIPTTGFVAILSAVGLALSLALQGSLSNLANGIVLISTSPFKEGDYISLNGIEGNVIEIKLLHTVICTLDNKLISTPNSKVVESELINFTANKTRKVMLNFSVYYTQNIDEVINIIKTVINNCPFVISKNQSSCYLDKIENNSFLIYCDCWCETRNVVKTKTDITTEVIKQFIKNNINFAQNNMNISIIDN